jgi:hypothetical protein
MWSKNKEQKDPAEDSELLRLRDCKFQMLWNLTTANGSQFLTLVLTVYLALALSNRNESQEFHVLLILIILVTTIFFCHALIRLCMMIMHPPSDEDIENQNLPSMIGPGGYANPVMPIRVALARDEEAAGIESDATKLPPPAYGLWRESVVCKHSFWISDQMLTPRTESGSKPHLLAT